MNNNKIIEILQQQTSKDYQICADIVTNYERYCTKERSLPFKKEIDAPMIQWISSASGYAQEEVQEVLNHLIPLIRNEVKMKIPFLK